MTRKNNAILIMVVLHVAVFVLSTLLILMMFSRPVKATDWDHGLFMGNANYGPKQVEKERQINAYKPRPTIRHVERAPRSYMPSMPRESVVVLRRPNEPQVRGWSSDRDDDDRADRKGCLKRVHVTGNLSNSRDQALLTARVQWASDVSFHHGERHMEIGNAAVYRFTCTTSQVDATGLFKQMIQTTVENLTDKSFTKMRCWVSARPCPSIVEEGEK